MTDAAAILAPPTIQKPAGRVISIDALRGFDMFWIAGGEGIVSALNAASQSTPIQFVSKQLHHVSWQGFVFYDLIFPLFVFLVGMSIVFSLDRIIEKEGLRAAHMRIVRRFALLYLLAILKDSGISDLASESPFSGVLQRMAWCYLFTALLYCNLKRRGLAIVFAIILVGYWVLNTFVAAPNFSEALAAGAVPAKEQIVQGAVASRFPHSYRSEYNIVTWFDSKYLPFREAGQRYDPEGLLSTFSAVSTCLLGVFAGYAMRNANLVPWKRAAGFIAVGVVLCALGYAWSGSFDSHMWDEGRTPPNVDVGLLWWQMPVIKKIWTSSYVLVAGGYSCVLVGLFSLIVDVFKFEKWAVPFIWIGANPLAVYLAQDFIAFEDLGNRIAGGPLAAIFGSYAPLVPATATVVCVFLFARFLYKRQIFLRV
ncbi:MAG: DUF5009 domain-containing protein [Candidatus Hydrogenedentes bacterium]|nr:DUF5009 domain-containing protein [Candidatus Hydrogenedentota bacterium]